MRTGTQSGTRQAECGSQTRRRRRLQAPAPAAARISMCSRLGRCCRSSRCRLCWGRASRSGPGCEPPTRSPRRSRAGTCRTGRRSRRRRSWQRRCLRTGVRAGRGQGQGDVQQRAPAPPHNSRSAPASSLAGPHRPPGLQRHRRPRTVHEGEAGEEEGVASEARGARVVVGLVPQSAVLLRAEGIELANKLAVLGAHRGPHLRAAEGGQGARHARWRRRRLAAGTSPGCLLAAAHPCAGGRGNPVHVGGDRVAVLNHLWREDGRSAAEGLGAWGHRRSSRRRPLRKASLHHPALALPQVSDVSPKSEHENSPHQARKLGPRR